MRVVGVVVDKAPITADQVQEVLAAAEGQFTAGNLSLELAQPETLSFRPGELLDLEGDRAELLMAWTDPAGTGAIPIFFLDEFGASGVIGRAGGIPWAPRAGTASSGVVVAVAPLWDYTADAPDLELMSRTVTHELGHQVGLYHSTEANGQRFDLLEDTPECPVELDTNGDGVLSTGDCVNDGADNLMFWQLDEDLVVSLTPDQLRMVGLGGAVRVAD